MSVLVGDAFEYDNGAPKTDILKNDLLHFEK